MTVFRPPLRTFIISTLAICFSGCHAMLVPYTDDPHTKLSYAISLFEADRLIPSERLINEVIKECKKTNNTECLAEGYLVHAIFIKNPALYNWVKRYEEKGFLDKTVTMDNRFKKSEEYLDKALALNPKDKAIYDEIVAQKRDFAH